MTKTEIQDTVLKKLVDKLQDTMTIRERISLKFQEWFQNLVEIPKPVAEDKSDAGGGGGGEGGAEAAG